MISRDERKAHANKLSVGPPERVMRGQGHAAQFVKWPSRNLLPGVRRGRRREGRRRPSHNADTATHQRRHVAVPGSHTQGAHGAQETRRRSACPGSAEYHDEGGEQRQAGKRSHGEGGRDGGSTTHAAAARIRSLETYERGRVV